MISAVLNLVSIPLLALVNWMAPEANHTYQSHLIMKNCYPTILTKAIVSSDVLRGTSRN